MALKMNEQDELKRLNDPFAEETMKLEISTKGTDISPGNGEHEHNKKGQWTRLLALAGYASMLGSAVPAGYCIGVVNSPAVHIRAWCHASLVQRYNIHLSDSNLELLWSAIVSLFAVGGAIGSLGGAWTANRFGRRGSSMICGVLLLLAAILFYWCRMLGAVEMLLIGRFIVGLAAGLITTSLPMYLTEMAPLALRGTLGVFCPLGLTAGVVVAQVCTLRGVLGSAETWHMAFSCYALLVIVCYAPVLYFPESPKWLFIIRGDREEAKKQLKRLRGNVPDEVIVKEMEDMEVEASVNHQVSGFREVLCDPHLLLPLVIVCAFPAGQQFSGINAIFFYSVTIFRKAGLSAEASEWASLGAGSLNLLVSLLQPFLMARYNRRPLMMFSCSFCCMALLSFTLMLYFIEDVSWFAQGCIACIFLYIFFYQFGVGPIPFFIGAELFEVAPRSVAMSMCSLSSWGCCIIIGMAFPSLQISWGALVFLPFSVNCLLLGLLTKYYLPETRGKDSSEVAPLMYLGFKSKVV